MEDAETKGCGFPEKIALCLSGGGYRAAGFHLGTLDYLDRLGLRDKVTMLSTVSGGTFVGTSYVLSQIDRKPFTAYLAWFYTYLRDSHYLENLLALLGTERPDRPGKHRNMIQAAADVYATSFLCDPQGKPILFGKVIDADLPLQVNFNATNFYSGETFPFQKIAQGSGGIGTTFDLLSQDDIGNIRLADIAAASSCFPTGFEPLAFPDDFVWPGEIPVLRSGRLGPGEIPATIPLMDGGVADNVGLGRIIPVITAGQEEPDLIIASDVDAKPIDLYPDFPLKPDAASFWQRESRIGLTMGSLNRILSAVFLFLVLTMAGQAIAAWRGISGGNMGTSGLFFALMTILLAAVVAGEIWWIRRAFRSGLLDWFDEKMAPGKGRAWDSFKRLTLGQVINIVKLRISSVVAMTSGVFMRCIRELTYDITQRDPAYSRKIITDMIYFVKDQQHNPFVETYVSPHPSPKLMAVVDSVADMRSTLWWEKDYQLPCLLACGQISLCLSLYLYYRDDHAESDPDGKVRRLLNSLQEDWVKFNENPYFLLEERYPNLKPFPSPSVIAGVAQRDVATQG